MTSLHVAVVYASHGDHESAQSLSYHLLPWARRSVLPEPVPVKREAEGEKA